MSRTATVLLTAVLMLLTCEVATRLFARIPADVSQRDPLIGRRFQPGLARHIFNYESNRPVFLRTNRMGFRGPEVIVPRPDSVRRIAVLGDSYTASMALPEEETFCGQLQKQLNEQSGGNPTWEVLNFGIFGSGTGQELALYRHLVRETDPDIVIVAFGNATDLRDNSRELSTNPIIQFDVDESGRLVQLPQSENRIRLSNMLNRFSRFYAWQKLKMKALKTAFEKKVPVDRGRNLIYARNEPPAYTRAWNITAALLKTFRDECRADGSLFMVIGIPSACQVYPDYFAQLTSETDPDADLDPLHPDERLGQICRELGIPWLPLTPVFRSRTPSRSFLVESEHLFIGGRSHLNAAGSRVVASELASWVPRTFLAARSESAERY